MVNNERFLLMAPVFRPHFLLESAQSHLGINIKQSYVLFNNLLNVEADMLGLNDIFWVSAIIFLALIPLV
jgi:DHA2 family multidrug resistance protein